MKPKKLLIANGKRKLVDYDSRSEEYKTYNKTRWKYDKDIVSFYNSKVWRDTSKIVLLKADYICSICGGEATMTDHIVSVKSDWNRRLDFTNLQAICKACNDRKAIKEKYRF